MAESRRMVKRNFEAPDEIRPAGLGTAHVVGGLGEITMMRVTLQPGWRWSNDVKPIVKTETCQVAHVGYAVSGRIIIKMNDGSQATIAPGMSYTIPPGHEAWVEGGEPFVAIEVMSAEQYAKPA